MENFVEHTYFENKYIHDFIFTGSSNSKVAVKWRLNTPDNTSIKGKQKLLFSFAIKHIPCYIQNTQAYIRKLNTTDEVET
jgi:hypothetical protein